MPFDAREERRPGQRTLRLRPVDAFDAGHLDPRPALGTALDVDGPVVCRRDLPDDAESESRSVVGRRVARIEHAVAFVGLGAFTNVQVGTVTPGWVQEIKGTVDARLLGLPADLQSSINDEGWGNSFEFEVDPEGWASVPDTPRSMSQVTWLYGTAETSTDAVYTTLETMYENQDSMGDYHELLSYYTNDDHWTREPHPGFSLHQGTQDFLDEYGLN